MMTLALPHRSVSLLSFLLTLFIPRVAAGQCVTKAESCTEFVAVGGGPSRILIYRNRSLTTPNDTVTRALIVSYIRLGEVSDWLFANHPMGNPPPPDGYAWSIFTLYAVWAVVVVILYVVCRWYAKVKSNRADWWLRYL